MKNRILSSFVLFAAIAWQGCKPEKNIEATVKFVLTYSINGQTPTIDGALSYTNAAGNIFNLKTLKYYLSNVVLVNTDGSRKELKNYQFINLSDASSQNFSFEKIPNGSFSKIEFYIGVDSLANSTGVHTGALDPANQMYWGWDFGYRFWLIEGIYQKTSSITSAFGYHIGTDTNLVKMSLLANFKIDGIERVITLNCNLDEFFKDPTVWDIKSEETNHSFPGQEAGAATLAKNMADMFSVGKIE